MERAVVKWRYRLGGKVTAQQVARCSGPPSSPIDLLLVALPGHLVAYSLDGERQWELRHSLDLRLLGCWDLDADGRKEILAGSAGLSGTQLHTFDLQGGQLLWESSVAPGQIGALKVVPQGLAPGMDLFWLPAAASVLRSYRFSQGTGSPALRWEVHLEEFSSDPYSFSSLAIGDLDRDGQSEVVIAGARHQILSIVLDASSGRELSRTSYLDDRALESGGEGQSLVISRSRSGETAIITISNHGTGAQYMFQGIRVLKGAPPSESVVLNSYPVGTRFVRGSVQDLDSDGSTEILVSRYDVVKRSHELLVLDAFTLEPKASLQNFFLLGIAATRDSSWPRILGFNNQSGERPGSGTLVAYRFDGTGFRETAWRPGIGSLAELTPRAFDEPLHDNPGSAPVVLGNEGAGRPEILVHLKGTDGLAHLVTTDAVTGSSVARYTVEKGLGTGLLAVRSDPLAARTRIVLGESDGSLVFLDGGLRVVRRVPIGGYFRNDALNGHSFEVAVVADLEGLGKKEVVVVDSRNRISRLTGVETATLTKGPEGYVLHDSAISQELLAVPAANGGSHLIVYGWGGAATALRKVGRSGEVVWQHFLAAGAAAPIGLNYGDFNADGQADVVFSGSAVGVYLRSTYALDGRSGETIWVSDVGTYWDASLAMWDCDEDAVNDVVLNSNVWKGFVLSGRTGEQLATPSMTPNFGGLAQLDYNGAPIVVGSTRSGIQLLSAADNAHLSSFFIQPGADEAFPYKTSLAWAAPQSLPDDERQSMAAVAPSVTTGWMVGVGTQAGSLKARRGSDGSPAWERALWQGTCLSGPPANRNPLSAVTAVDVNGDGRVEFVVGGSDGWLYAVTAESGDLLWSLDLGYPVGEPIAADVDNDGSSELLVPAADGNLYCIDSSNSPG